MWLLFFLLFFFFPSIMFALLFFLPPGRKSDPGSHSRLPPPLPTTVRALHFYRENSSDLPSSTRVDFYVVGYCLHIKPFLVYIPNISSSTPSALPDSSCLQVEKYKFCGHRHLRQRKNKRR